MQELGGHGYAARCQMPGTFITQKDECFRLKNKDRVFDISPLKVESIVISNQAMISSQAVVQALEHNIDIIFLDDFGDPLGRVSKAHPLQATLLGLLLQEFMRKDDLG
jgi:CRISPR/Cas system-associated endonuclease Cas1